MWRWENFTNISGIIPDGGNSQNSWLHLTSIGKERDHALVWYSPEPDPETRMGMQVLYLGDDPREHQQGSGEVIQGREVGQPEVLQFSVHATRMSTNRLWAGHLKSFCRKAGMQQGSRDQGSKHYQISLNLFLYISLIFSHLGLVFSPG